IDAIEPERVGKRRDRVRHVDARRAASGAFTVLADQRDDVESGRAQRGNVNPTTESGTDDDCARPTVHQYPSSASTTCKSGSPRSNRPMLSAKISTAVCCNCGVYHEMWAASRTFGCV